MAKTKFDQVLDLLTELRDTSSKAIQHCLDEGCVPLLDVSKIESQAARLSRLMTVRREEVK